MNDKTISSVCFTGHRKLENPDAVRIATEREVIRLIEEGAIYFLVGMAQGFDLLAADLILKLKKDYPHLYLYAILPCPPKEQTKYFSQKDKALYFDILHRADRFAELSVKYYKGCMHERNRFLVNYSECCVCYLTRETGGTAYTVNEARKRGREIINIACQIK